MQKPAPRPAGNSRGGAGRGALICGGEAKVKPHDAPVKRRAVFRFPILALIHKVLFEVHRYISLNKCDMH